MTGHIYAGGSGSGLAKPSQPPPVPILTNYEHSQGKEVWKGKYTGKMDLKKYLSHKSEALNLVGKEKKENKAFLPCNWKITVIYHLLRCPFYPNEIDYWKPRLISCSVL